MKHTPIREMADLDPYVPTTISDWVGRDPESRFRVVSGTLVSADISGFTKLSERLARRGTEGTEELTTLINTCFGGMIAAVSQHGGDVLKFGGDALLVLFTGADSAVQACAAAVKMRACIAEPLVSGTAGRVQVRISQGIH